MVQIKHSEIWVTAGKETQGEIARSYNVSRWTISRLGE
jgi:DNA-binding transcriptional regulator LsrR (DeoR family)